MTGNGGQGKFLRVFKEEHQIILNRLLELHEAVSGGDAVRARELVEVLDDVMGPHFRVEEEVLYPMLEAYLGEQNVCGLLEEHVGATTAVHRLKSNIGDPAWLRENGEAVFAELEGFFMHVAACDGLSIIVGRFSEVQKLVLARALDRVQKEEHLPLTRWKPSPQEVN